MRLSKYVAETPLYYLSCVLGHDRCAMTNFGSFLGDLATDFT